jgi:hypothetical protein
VNFAAKEFGVDRSTVQRCLDKTGLKCGQDGCYSSPQIALALSRYFINCYWQE